MSSIRLFILGTLATSGPLHGHQIRQQAQSDRTEMWTDIRVGSVYGALKRMASEGLIREVRTERVGNRPERTIYEVTPEGNRALAAIRTDALRDIVRHDDPFDLALAQSRDLAEEDLARMVANRITRLEAEIAAGRHQKEMADPYVNEAERLVIEHIIERLTAELRWHTEVAARIPKIAEDFRAGIGGPPRRDDPTDKDAPS